MYYWVRTSLFNPWRHCFFRSVPPRDSYQYSAYLKFHMSNLPNSGWHPPPPARSASTLSMSICIVLVWLFFAKFKRRAEETLAPSPPGPRLHMPKALHTKAKAALPAAKKAHPVKRPKAAAYEAPAPKRVKTEDMASFLDDACCSRGSGLVAVLWIGPVFIGGRGSLYPVLVYSPEAGPSRPT